MTWTGNRCSPVSSARKQTLDLDLGKNTWLLTGIERRLVPIPNANANGYASFSLLVPTGRLLGLRAPMRTHGDGFLHTAALDHRG